MVGIWSKYLTLQQYSWPLCERPNKSRVQGHATREYPATNPILLAYSIWQLEATPEKSRKVFLLFSALRKSKNTCPLRSANEKPNRTEPICVLIFHEPNRTENRKSASSWKTKLNRTEPTPPCNYVQQTQIDHLSQKQSTHTYDKFDQTCKRQGSQGIRKRN